MSEQTESSHTLERTKGCSFQEGKAGIWGVNWLMRDMDCRRMHRTFCIIDNIATQRASFVQQPPILRAVISVVSTEVNADTTVGLTTFKHIWNLLPRIREVNFPFPAGMRHLPPNMQCNLCITPALIYSHPLFTSVPLGSSLHLCKPTICLKIHFLFSLMLFDIW